MSKTTPPKRKTSGVLRTLRARTQSATAHLTAEEDWDTEVPNIRLSRVFAIVLILHVVAVGGILAFQIMNPESGKEATAAARPGAATEGASSGASGADRIDQSEMAPGNGTAGSGESAFGPDVESLEHYRVQSGDTPMSIARRFQVNVADFERVNKLGAGKQLFPGLIVFIPDQNARPGMEDDARRLLEGARAPAEVARAVPVNPGADTVQRPLVLGEDGAVQPTASREERAPAPTPDPGAAAGWSGARADTTAEPAAAAAEPAAPAPRPEVVKPAPKPAAAPETGTPAVATFRDYEVQAGDTAFGLGRKFGVKPDALLKLNGIDDPTKLRAGTVIRIPVRD